MNSEKIDEIIARHSMLQSLSASDLEDSWRETSAVPRLCGCKSKIQEEPTQQARIEQQVASLDLQVQDQQLAEIMEEERHTVNRCQFFPVCTSSRHRK